MKNNNILWNPKLNPKIIVVMPAYNAGKTVKKTYNDLPKDLIKEVILTDDASHDKTIKKAKALGITVYVHKKNKGYGANQKTCYDQALKRKPDVVVMVHPDYQYDPKIIPQLIEPIQSGRADAVFGSRMMIPKNALQGGMPYWKFAANIVLTKIENFILRMNLTEYHSGFRAYPKNVL